MLNIPTIYKHHQQVGDNEATKVGWTSIEEQQEFFANATKLLDDADLPLSGLTLHDAGCGFGALYSYLKSRDLLPSYYYGSEQDEDMHKAASALVDPKHATIYRATFRSRIIPTANIVAIIGSLAYYKPRLVEELLHDMWKKCDVAMLYVSWWQLPPNPAVVYDLPLLRKCVTRFNREARPSLVTSVDSKSGYEKTFLLLK